MKKVLGAIVMLLVLSLFSGAAMAELLAEQEVELIHAADAAEDWRTCIAQKKEQFTDEDSQILFGLCDNVLMLCQSGLLEDTEPQKTLTQILGEAIPRERSAGTDEESHLCNTSMVWVADMNSYITVDAYTRDGFARYECSLYNAQGDYLASGCLEIGMKDEQLMALVIDYDNLQGTTGRFAIHTDAEQREIIFTKTFGKNMKVVLDVDKWQSGAEIGAWDKALLLPASIYNQ